MRVAMVGPFGLHPKSTMSARARPLATALARRGHAVTLIMPPWHTPEEASREWSEGQVTLRYVGLAGLGVPGAGHLAVAARLVAAAREWSPDVIHAFKPKAYSGLAATGLSWLDPGRPIVMDTDDWEGPGGWNAMEPYSGAMRRFFEWQERSGLTRSAAVTVASRSLETLVWAMGVDPSRVRYVPNAVQPVATVRPPRDDRSGRTLLLYTRFFEFPIERPLDVLTGVRARGIDARLVVAGKGLFGEEVEFLDRARERGLADAVEYVGWADETTRRRLFQQADAALYPFSDTLVNRTKSPAKLLELMAAGVPVVAEAVGEVAAFIRHDRSGLLVAPGDLDAFVVEVSRLLETPGLADRIAAGAEERVRDRYTWDLAATEVEALYQRVLRTATSTDPR